MNYVLIKTDGYTIQHRVYSSSTAAIKEMQSQYNDAIPNGDYVLTGKNFLILMIIMLSYTLMAKMYMFGK